MLRTVLFTSITTLLLTIATSTPASAISICPSGTMADYIAFGSTGCQLENLTFLNFSYSGSFKMGLNPTRLPAPPSEISAQPRNNPNLGLGGAALGFSLLQPSPSPAFGGTYWGDVSIGFEVFARVGPGIVRDDLTAGLASIADLQSADIRESVVPGGSLSITQGVSCFGSILFPPSSPFCANPANLSIPFTRFQEIDITGRNVRDIEAGFATPEPTTLLLWSTTMAGLGIAARWRRRSKQSRGV